VLSFGMRTERHSSVTRPRRGVSSLPHPTPRNSCVQFPPFLQFVRLNSSRFNTSKIISLFRISLILNNFNPTRINTSGNKDLKSPRINTSGAKDLKSLRINTSKKQGRGAGPTPSPTSTTIVFVPPPRPSLTILRPSSTLRPNQRRLACG